MQKTFGPPWNLKNWEEGANPASMSDGRHAFKFACFIYLALQILQELKT